MPGLNGLSGPKSSPDWTLGFNRGCDARLMGRPLGMNPYSSIDDLSAHMGWRAGWQHASEFWAEDVRGRWPYLALPRVLPTTAWEEI